MSQRPIPLDQLPPLPPGAQGLDAGQVQSQRARGFNDIVSAGGSGWREVLGDSLRDPMLWFLLFTAGLFGLLGQRTEALTLLAALVPLLGMDAYLNHRTRASSASLASRLASSARVLREGCWQELPARELVVGDLVEVAPGEYFPADGLLVAGHGLQVDASTLTGESLPVPKRIFEGAALPASADEVHWASAGTRLLTGSARLRVMYIGADTLYGEIVHSATAGRQAATPLQQAIGELVRVLLVLALLLCAMLAGMRLWQGHDWVDALLSAVTLAVAALPEEFPVVYTFFLGVGVFRLARRKALVRRAVAVENIGRVSCLVSDKTGTLTAGSLVLAHRAPAQGLSEAELLELACRAARADSGDPLDQALHQAQGLLPVAEKLADFPFTEARRRETLSWRLADGRRLACSKGAPETVLDLCPLAPAERADWLARVEAFACDGHKVIACAQRVLAPGEDAASEASQGFSFGGLLAFEDPVREGVPAAVAECLAAGLRVIMVTGDHPATAAAVAREIGLGGAEPRVRALATDDDPAACLAAETPDVVARASPTQKFALVKALQARGERVAVTGDGVNDVPALRLADVGVAMGERGTRSAREVASVVLLDDRFRTLVDAVAEGRQLFQNLRLAFAYLLLVHLPLVLGAALLPMLGLPLLFLPIHIVWLELVIHPTAMLAFQELPQSGALAPVARSAGRARFFTAPAWWCMGLLGGLLSLALSGSYLYALGADHDVPHARAMALSLLLLASAALASGLSGLRQPSARWLVVGTLASVLVLVQLPTSSRLLGLSPLHAVDWAQLSAVFVLTMLATRLLGRYLKDAA